MAPAKPKTAVAAKPVPPLHQRVADEVKAHPAEASLIAVSLVAISGFLALLRKLRRTQKELKDTKEVRARRTKHMAARGGLSHEAWVLGTSGCTSSVRQARAARQLRLCGQQAALTPPFRHQELAKQRGLNAPATPTSDLAARMAAGFGSLPSLPTMPKLW